MSLAWWCSQFILFIKKFRLRWFCPWTSSFSWLWYMFKTSTMFPWDPWIQIIKFLPKLIKLWLIILFAFVCRICAGCNTEIGHGRFLSCMSAVWHPECFRCNGCSQPISDYEVQFFFKPELQLNSISFESISSFSRVDPEYLTSWLYTSSHDLENIEVDNNKKSKLKITQFFYLPSEFVKSLYSFITLQVLRVIYRYLEWLCIIVYTLWLVEFCNWKGML